MATFGSSIDNEQRFCTAEYAAGRTSITLYITDGFGAP